jgi:hypothetical protein
MHVDSADYVALSWKNSHRSSLNGFGYEFYSPSTFRIAFDSASQDVSLRIKPIEQLSTENNIYLPELLYVKYHVYVAGEELDLYNAMNCQKGKYMYWAKLVSSPEEIKQEAIVKLNVLKS